MSAGIARTDRDLNPSAPLRAAAARYQAATGALPLFLFEGSGALAAAGWRVPRHRVTSVWAPHHVLGYRLEGTATVTRRCGGAEQHRFPAIGSVTFSPGEEPVEWAADAAIEAIHVYIEAQALSGIRPFFAVSDAWLAAYFRLLATEFALCDDAGAGAQFLDETEEMLLRHLMRRYSLHARGCPPLAEERTRVSPLRASLTRRIEDYIEANLDRSIPVQALAELARMSGDHFGRAFRAATGKTPHRFVLDQRLRHAAAMLKSASASVAEISRACGFRNAAHFSVKFRARFGVTPSQYRRSA